MHWEDSDLLAADLAALPPLDKATVESTDADWLVDAVHPGAPLVISFAYTIWNKPVPFYFFGRSKKLEGVTGQPLNRILLRDRTFHWYLYGVPGLGENVDEMVARLKRIIAIMRPREVWCIGDSLGGYAAVMIGFLLNAERIVGISPVSTIDAHSTRLYNEKRFLWRMDFVAANPPQSGYYDLPRLGRETGYRGKLHLIIGTSGGITAPDTVNFDVMHAYRFGHVPGLKLHYVRDADHDYVTLLLRQRGKIDKLLLECLFNYPPDDAEAAALDGFKPHIAAASAAPRQSPQAKTGNTPLPGTLMGPGVRLDDGAVAAAEATEKTFLVDKIVPKAPLLICFGEAPPSTRAGFDFFDVSRKLQSMCERPINRILLRDPERQWWLRGAQDIGSDCCSVEHWLRQCIAHMQPERVVCLGNGMGGYAAIMFAMLLHANHAVALNPLALLDEKFAQLCHDPRHLQPLGRLDCAPSVGGPRDLLRLAADTGYAGKIDVLFGTMPPAAGVHVGNHNSVHAARLGLLPNTRLHPCPEVVDAELLRWLDFRKVLTTFLYRAAFTD